MTIVSIHSNTVELLQCTQDCLFHRAVCVVDGFAHRDAEWYVKEKSSRLFLWFQNHIEPRPHYEYHWREGDMDGGTRTCM